MPTWLIGKALAPFVMLLLAFFVTRPAQRWVERKMRDGRLKRTLLIHSDRNRAAYIAWYIVLVGGLLAVFTWASWYIHH